MEDEKVQRYVEEFNAIFEKLTGKGKTQAAIGILQEMGKDRRFQEIVNRKNGNNNEQATEKQKNFLRGLGVEFPENISKKEASALINEALNGNGQTTH
ncbi:MAG TPA: hypothetical protein DHV62_10380 [Elusimicrobia bacterium]|jgi:DNA helicase TIP49 (TBP-interacting protein)|nr:hypothetical protein [Elusimicrobiota bacterium]